MRLSRKSRIVVVATMLLACLAAAGARASDLVEQYTLAREFDPVFQAALRERQLADQMIKESRSGVLPMITASADFSSVNQNIKRSDNPIFFVGQNEYFARFFDIRLTQPVYRAEQFNRIPLARAEARQAEALFTSEEQDLIVRIAEAYFGHLAARDNMHFTTAERIAIGRQMEEAEERLGLGLAAITDVSDTRAKFALAEAAEIVAAGELEESLRAVEEITGAYPEGLEVLSLAFPLVEPDQMDVEAWVEAALFQNPMVKAREAAAEIEQRRVKGERSQRIPTVDFVASYDNRDTGGSIFVGGGGSEIANTEFALRLGIPIYQGGKVAARTAGAKLRKQVVLEQLELERRRIERQTRASFRGVTDGIALVRALERTVFAHESALSAKEEGMRSGLATGREVLDARRDLFSARSKLAEARYNYILNGLKLKQSAGTLSPEDLEAVNVYLQSDE